MICILIDVNFSSTQDKHKNDHSTGNEEYLYKTEYCDNDDSNKSTNDEYCIMETTDNSEEILLENDEVEHIEDCVDPVEIEINDEEIIDIYEDSANISDIFPKTISYPIDDCDKHSNSIEICQNDNDEDDDEKNHLQQEEKHTKTTEFLMTPLSSSTDSIAKTTTIQLSKSSVDNSIQNLPSSSSNDNITKDNEHPSDAILAKNPTDPDERFLLSCAPILQRLNDKKNGLARLRIQQILYEIEFGQLNDPLF